MDVSRYFLRTFHGPSISGWYGENDSRSQLQTATVYFFSYSDVSSIAPKMTC